VLLAGAFASVATATTYEPLSLAIQGSGVVHLSNGYEIGCTGSCGGSATLALPPNVTMTATPAHGWTLAGWHGACHGTSARCTLPVTGPWHVGVTFALATRAKLGTSNDPVPLGKPFAIGGGWRLKVVSAIPNDTRALLPRDATLAPPAGAQDFLVLVEATYTAGGSGNPYSLLTDLEAEGAHSTLYTNGNNGCGSLPSPALGSSDSVFSGQTVSGNICWQIASNDAASLKLDAVPEPGAQGIWFALH
jgi:hypothetical protein